jgi:hypothetical protein
MRPFYQDRLGTNIGKTHFSIKDHFVQGGAYGLLAKSGGSWLPRSDYWLATLFRDLIVGDDGIVTQTLQHSVSPPQRGVLSFAFCSSSLAATAAGGIGKVLIVNLHRQIGASVQLDWPGNRSLELVSQRCEIRIFRTIFILKTIIYQDRLGTNIGKPQKAMRFLQAGISHDWQRRQDWRWDVDQWRTSIHVG